MIVTVKRTFSARCPVRDYGYNAMHGWETGPQNTSEEALCRLFDHLREKHLSTLVDREDTDQ